MFNLLVTSNPTAWETDQLMRMNWERFGEYNGAEGQAIDVNKPATLVALEKTPVLLMYENGTESPNVDVVRYGAVTSIRLAGENLTFRFTEEGRFSKATIREFADRLGIHDWEFNRTHWAIKDGGIPSAMKAKLQRSYDVVLSFAGEDRVFVEAVANHLVAKSVRVFYDRNEQVDLWGKDLMEHFERVYRLSGQYCVLFVSKHYVEKVWTRRERRSALARALVEHGEYILPARFDDTEVPGLLPTVAFEPLTGVTPATFAEKVLQKLGRL